MTCDNSNQHALQRKNWLHCSQGKIKFFLWLVSLNTYGGVEAYLQAFLTTIRGIVRSPQPDRLTLVPQLVQTVCRKVILATAGGQTQNPN